MPSQVLDNQPTSRPTTPSSAAATSAPATSARPFTIVLGLDLTRQDASGFAFDEALRIASRIAGAELHVVYVAPGETTQEKAQQDAGLLRLYVGEKAAVLGVRGPQQVGLHVRAGDPAREIVQLASDVVADMIVLGTHSPVHRKSVAVGTTVERVMAASSCPVFVAGPKPHEAPSTQVTIEPPCPDCVAERRATSGRVFWCARHGGAQAARRGHIYSYQPEIPFAMHDSEVVPTGIDA